MLFIITNSHSAATDDPGKRKIHATTSTKLTEKVFSQKWLKSSTLKATSPTTDGYKVARFLSLKQKMYGGEDRTIKWDKFMSRQGRRGESSKSGLPRSNRDL
jgi:hypothetical protein